MPASAPRRVQIALAVGGLTVLAVACSQPASITKPKSRPIVIESREPLPPVVNGVPLLDLAKHALGTSEAYSVVHPLKVRAVITTQAALWAQVPANAPSDASAPEYVVELQGRFNCGSCGTTTASPTPTIPTTTDPSEVRVSTMVLELPMPLSGATTGVAVGLGTHDLAKLGRVYDLDPYIGSLVGASVPNGPLPG